ncbi:MAG: hypothetical protein IJ046_01355 [Clostridia bacterium]|nr:hypothetical protein [Clostridia bacterium]MBQ8914808.1 hypothetical protein [Clostridia bacterium]
MENSEKKLLLMVGICRGAGATIIGVPQICEQLHRKGAGDGHIIVLEAGDTSQNTHKKITDKCNFYKVRHVKLSSDCDTLGKAVGKGAVAAVAVMGENFCRAVEGKLPLTASDASSNGKN